MQPDSKCCDYLDLWPADSDGRAAFSGFLRKLLDGQVDPKASR
jgi:hypothetical protein